MSSKSSIRRNDKPFAGPHGHLLLQLEHHGALAGATRSDDKRSLRQPGRLDSVGNLLRRLATPDAGRSHLYGLQEGASARSLLHVERAGGLPLRVPQVRTQAGLPLGRIHVQCYGGEWPPRVPQVRTQAGLPLGRIHVLVCGGEWPPRVPQVRTRAALPLGRIHVLVCSGEWPPSSSASSTHTSRAAPGTNHLHVGGEEWQTRVPQVYAHEHAHKQRCPWNEDTCLWAVENGHLECLKYAHERGCPLHEDTCLWAAENGHLECLKYALEQSHTI